MLHDGLLAGFRRPDDGHEVEPVPDGRAGEAPQIEPRGAAQCAAFLIIERRDGAAEVITPARLDLDERDERAAPVAAERDDVDLGAGARPDAPSDDAVALAAEVARGKALAPAAEPLRRRFAPAEPILR